jgi:hypothetical protein
VRGDHAAADVHPHRRRDDRADRGDHAADGRALAQVHVRHHRQVLEDERHLRRVEQLLAGFVLDRHAVGPQFDRLAAGALQGVHVIASAELLPHDTAEGRRQPVASKVAQCCMLARSSGRVKVPTGGKSKDEPASARPCRGSADLVRLQSRRS